MSIHTRNIHLKGGRHAVLLLHGLSGTPLEMRFLAKALHRGGFTAVAPYIEGYGLGSPCSDWKSWLRAACREFDVLRQQYATVSVGGLCIGATLSLALAAERPDVHALSLLSTTLRYDGWTIPWYHVLLNLAYHTPLRRFYTFREAEPYGLKNEELRSRVARSMADTANSEIGSSTISLAHIYHARQLAGHVRRRLPSITTPALVMHAVDDDTASPRNAETVHRRLGSTRKRKILLDDCYHIITMDNEREIVARQTQLFFEEGLPAAAALPAVGAEISSRALQRARRRG